MTTTMRFEWALGIALRLVLAAIFIAAAVPKLLDPATFLEQTANYDLFPSLSPLIAVTLPPLELISALGILGLPLKWRLGSTVVLFGLMVVFTVAVAAAYARDIDTECGCFGKGSERIGLQKLMENLALILGSATLFVIELRALVSQSLRGRATSTTDAESNS
jgi:putative oxidoreductase